MKFLTDLATEAFTDDNSVGRFIYLEVSRGAEAEAATPEAIAKAEAIAKELNDDTGMGFGVEAGNFVFPDAFTGNLSVPVAEVHTAAEAQSMLDFAINLYNKGALEGLDSAGFLKAYAKAGFRSERGAIPPVRDPDTPIMEGPARDPDVPIGMEATPETFIAALDIEAINASLPDDITERVESVEYDAMTGGYLVILEDGGRAKIEGGDATSAEALTAAILDALGMTAAEVTEAVETENPMAASIAAFKAAQALEGTIDNTKTAGRGLRSVPFAARQAFVAGLPAAVRAQIAPDGRYNGSAVENGNLVKFLNETSAVAPETPVAGVEAAETPEEAIEADHYLSVLDNLGAQATDVEAVIKALKANPVHARLIQKDLKLLGFYNGRIDGILGRGSRGALEGALAAKNEDGSDRFATIYDIEQAARQAEVVKEGKSHGGRNPSVDALMAKIKSGAEITAADVAFTGHEQGGSADRTREVMDFIEQAVGDGEISNEQASEILEMMMAEDKYNEDLPQDKVIANTLYAGSGGFIGGLSSINQETRIREVSGGLRDRIRGSESRAKLTEDMHASGSKLDFSAVDLNGEVEIDGKMFDMKTLTKLYILTGGGQTAQGKGAVEVPIGDMTKALKIHNLVYRDGALVGTMENGCQGNLVIIPVNRQYVKYVPPVQPRGPRVKPPEEKPPTEESDPDYHSREECHNGDWSLREWYGNWGAVTWTILNANDPRCDHGDGGDDGDDGDGGKNGDNSPGDRT